MVIDERVARFDVEEAGLTTAEGVRVGDPVETLHRTYGAALSAAPNAYDEREPDYRVTSPDERYAYWFETPVGKVARMFAGDAKAMAFIEGCL